MEKVINVLYEIEKKANGIVDNTAEKKEKIYENYQKELTVLDEKMEKASKEKIEQLRIEINTEIDREHQVLVKSLNEKLKQMEADYHKNHDKLVDAVLAKITGV